MSVDLKGELICPYCGSKVQLSDKELEDYKTMRLNMLHFLRAEADYSKDKEDGDFFETYCFSLKRMESGLMLQKIV